MRVWWGFGKATLLSNSAIWHDPLPLTRIFCLLPTPRVIFSCLSRYYRRSLDVNINGNIPSIPQPTHMPIPDFSHVGSRSGLFWTNYELNISKNSCNYNCYQQFWKGSYAPKRRAGQDTNLNIVAVRQSTAPNLCMPTIFLCRWEHS